MPKDHQTVIGEKFTLSLKVLKLLEVLGQLRYYHTSAERATGFFNVIFLANEICVFPLYVHF